MPRLALIVIGNEILSGKVEEQNARYAISYLRSIGADLERVAIVPDTENAIAEEVRRSSEAFDFVITSGGVGPTHDDITYESIAHAFGVELREEAAVAHMLIEYFGDQLTDDHLRMARFPAGSEVHKGGDFPLPIPSIRNVFVLPGIPPLFQTSLRALGKRFSGSPFYTDEVFCGQDEGVFAAELRELQSRFPDLALGSYPFHDEMGRFQVRITVEGRDEARVKVAVEELRRLAD